MAHSNQARHKREDAAEHLTYAVARVRPAQTAAEVRSALETQELEDTEIICVVDEGNRLLGLLPFADLLALAPDKAVGEAMHPPLAVAASEDQEKVANFALHHGLNSVPVVDSGGRLLGVVPTQALLQILRHEHVEDIHRFGGLQRETAHARSALDTPPLKRARDRLPWLLFGLLGSVLATFIVSRLEAELEKQLALAFFIPGLVYMADAIGTQTEAVVVRGLSLSRIGMGRLLLGELRTGLLIGLVLGLLTFPAVWAVFGELRLAIAVGGALLVSGGLATTLGLLLPWVLLRFRQDPAFGSGPLATVIQDVLTLLVYVAFIAMLY